MQLCPVDVRWESLRNTSLPTCSLIPPSMVKNLKSQKGLIFHKYVKPPQKHE